MLGPGPRLIKKRIYRAVISQRLRNTAIDYISRHIFTLLTNYAAGRRLFAMHSVYSRRKWHVDVYLCIVTHTYTGVCQQCPDK